MEQIPIVVVETNALLSAAKACMTDEERTDAITMIAADPRCGFLRIADKITTVYRRK